VPGKNGEQSFTAKNAEVAKEEKSLTAKDAEDATTERFERKQLIPNHKSRITSLVPRA